MEIIGRVRSIKRKKNHIFLILYNTASVQIVVKKDLFSEYNKLNIGKGDIVSVKVEKEGEKKNTRYKVLLPSYLAKNILIISKRVQNREIVQCEQENLKKYSEILLRIRNYLRDLEYIEVTLPILTDGETSSKAHSYKTNPYRYKGELFLRKTMDPFLRILSCYDYNKIFSFGKCFRNEYITSLKQSEFEMLSIFTNYQSEEEAINLSLEIIKLVLQGNDVKVKYYQSEKYKSNKKSQDIDIIRNFHDKTNSYATLNNDNTTKEFKIKIKGLTVVHGVMEIKNYGEYISKIKQQGKRRIMVS
jgi:lysyl-tRNA synthetase class 2